MSLLDSRINTIATIALSASVDKADSANPTLYGRVAIESATSQPDNYLISNVPSTFNTTVSIVNDLYVYGNAFFNNQITIQSLVTTVSALRVKGRGLIDGSTSILSDLYVSGNAYFGSSSIGSYLKIDDMNSTLNNYLNITGVSNLLTTNYYNKSTIDAQQALLSSNTSLKLNIIDYNATMTSNYYTNITSDSRFQRALNFYSIIGGLTGFTTIDRDTNNVINLYVNPPLRAISNNRSATLSIDPSAYYTQTTINTILTTDYITDKSVINTNGNLTTSLTIIKTSLDSKFSSSNKPNIADVVGLQTSLDGKFSPTYKPSINDVIDLSNQLGTLFGAGRLPTIGQIIGLQGALDLKYSSTNPPTISNIAGLSASLANAFSPSNLPTISNVQGLSTSLNEKFSSINPPQISNIPNLSASLANAFSPSNLPTISNVQGLSASLGEKFSASNQPSVSNIVGLQSLLDGKFSSLNPPSISSIVGLDSLLGLGGGSIVNLGNYYNKSQIDTRFNTVNDNFTTLFGNDTRLADRADQKFEFEINASADPNYSQILRIGSITYQSSLLGDGKMATIKIYLSQDKSNNYDFHLLVNFKLSADPISIYGVVNGLNIYSYFNCQYYLFSDGAGYNNPAIEIYQETNIINDANGNPVEYKTFTFYLDIAYNPAVSSGKNLVLINGNAPFTVLNQKITRFNWNLNYRGKRITPSIVYNTNVNPQASNISGIDTYIWERCPRMTIHPSWSDSTRFYSLGMFYLPQNGKQAVLTLTACQGYGFTGSHKSATYTLPQNYQCKIYIYSGNANGDTPAAGIWANSIALDAGSNTSGRVDKGSFHLAFYDVIGMWAKPNNIYLCPYIDDPSNYVSVWVQNTAYWGLPLITCETNGLWYRDGFLYVSTALPNTGVLRIKNRYENYVVRTT